MNGRSFVQYAAKPLLVNTIENGTKAYIQARRNSSAKASLSKAVNGVAVDDLHVLMHWDDISDPKQVGYVSNLFWTRKRSSEIVYGTNNECTICTTCNNNLNP